VRLVGVDSFKRLPFGFQRLLLLTEFRHSTAKLLQAHQTFLISVQEAVRAPLHSDLFLL
jgi:hypothetical protein